MLKLRNVTKVFTGTNSQTVLQDISLTVKEGEFVAIIGPSGVGKSTLLNLIAGFEYPSAGSVLFEGQPIIGPGRDRAMIFQQDISFPWLSVADNIAFGLRLQKMPEELVKIQVDYYLQITGLADVAQSYPHTLSGGMRQRVAFARTLAANPRLVLLDEPFGALDVQTRAAMQNFLADLWQKEQKTMILVTHDLEEAIYLADRVVVLGSRPGTIVADIAVDLPRSRQPEIKFDDEFIKLKKLLAQYFT